MIESLLRKIIGDERGWTSFIVIHSRQPMVCFIVSVRTSIIVLCSSISTRSIMLQLLIQYEYLLKNLYQTTTSYFNTAVTLVVDSMNRIICLFSDIILSTFRILPDGDFHYSAHWKIESVYRSVILDLPYWSD